MTFDFTNRRVVVAGGSRGIGRSIALGFAAAGAKVSICARGAAVLEATGQEIAAYGNAFHAATCDLADADAVARYVTKAGDALGGIDILVNNASGFGMGDDEAGWSAGLSVDVMAMVRTSHTALPFLLKAEGASIIHISSIAGFRASTRAAAYAAVKAAMISYTGSQAAMLARQGVRVNCIAPGSIEFPGGTSASSQAMHFTTGLSRASPSVAWAHPKRLPMLRCFLHLPTPAGSPARPSRSMAGSCWVLDQGPASEVSRLECRTIGSQYPVEGAVEPLERVTDCGCSQPFLLKLGLEVLVAEREHDHQGENRG
jgi:3-oxoacyl-[acyl-carrier protein] reductase